MNVRDIVLVQIDCLKKIGKVRFLQEGVHNECSGSFGIYLLSVLFCSKFRG